ncbi:DcrB-related protein [Serratia proteamaculans]
MNLYSIDEGVFDIPSGFTDRTINTFVLGDPGKSQFNVSISRDIPLPNEQVEEYVERQLGVLKKNIKGYKLLQNRACLLGQKNEGIEVYGTWQEGKQVIYQRQAAFFMMKNKAIIFSATSGKKFDEQLDKYWKGVLASFR